MTTLFSFFLVSSAQIFSVSYYKLGVPKVTNIKHKLVKLAATRIRNGIKFYPH